MPDDTHGEETHQPTVEELKAKAYQPMADAMKSAPLLPGQDRDHAEVLRPRLPGFRHLVHARRERPLPGDQGRPREGLRVHQQVEHGRRHQRRHARAGHGRHRPQGGHAGHGGQEPALQVPGRRGRLPAHGRHQGPGQVHRVRQARAAGPRRREPRRHRPAQVLPHPGHAARRVRDPGVARRPAGHGLRHPGRPHQRPQGRGPASIDDVKIAFIGCGRRQRRHQPPHLHLRRRPREVPIVDSKGILHKGRTDIEAVKDEWVDKWEYCQITNAEQRTGGIAEALRGRRRVHRAQQAGPGHHPAGLDPGHGAGPHRVPVRQPHPRDVALGRQGGRRRRGRHRPLGLPQPGQQLGRASPASSAAPWTCAPRPSPTRCASPPPWSSPRWPRTRAWRPTTSCPPWTTGRCSRARPRPWP